MGSGATGKDQSWLTTIFIYVEVKLSLRKSKGREMTLQPMDLTSSSVTNSTGTTKLRNFIKDFGETGNKKFIVQLTRLS